MYRVPTALAPVVYVPGLAYEALVRLRNRLYASAILPQHRLPAPVISIGNITLGGSGKTPLVICVAQMLANLGRTPAVLTRGYGRAYPSETRIIAPGETAPDGAAMMGDEPALIQRHVPSAWLGVSKNRLEAGRRIADRDPNTVFILDDGFQHRKLHRDLDIVIVDESQPLRSNRLFPRGTLREPVSELQRCDMVVLHGSPDGTESDAVEITPRDLKPGAAISRCSQRIQAIVPFLTWKHESSSGKIASRNIPSMESAYLVSALGNPERFQRDIRRLGIGGPGATFFPDHRPLSGKDWKNCVEKARRKGAQAIITTEKDAIKISAAPDFQLFVAIQATEMDDAAGFETALRKCIEDKR